MKTSDFDFDLPRELIAQHPVSPRDAARLLVVGDSMADHGMGDLPSLLQPGDILVFNDTRVIPARLTGRRGQAKVEVTLHKNEAPDRWRAFAKGARRVKLGDKLIFSPDFSAEVTEKGDGGEVTLVFNRVGAALQAALEQHGIMPLPPYIQRDAPGDLTNDSQDRADYQTIFAKESGAVAAPTAGLHYTPALLQALDARGIGRVTVTLHVGAGTFLPVKVEDTSEHRMHSELGTISAAAAEAINAAKDAGGRVVAVGTTSLRLLESAADAQGRVQPFAGDTDIFITPGYQFKIVDVLLTNFHLPRSTLFMLVSAFAGLARMKAAYEHAKKSGYRFYSFGDCCLLQRAQCQLTGQQDKR